MQTTLRKTDVKRKKESKDEPLKNPEDKLKSGVYSISARRDFVQKSTAADIYAQKKKSSEQIMKAPRKLPGTSNPSSNVSPMKGLLKSSASSISQISRTDKTPTRNEAKASSYSARRSETPRKQPALTNVTVNSPAVRRKLDLNSERTPATIPRKDVGSLRKADKSKETGKTKEVAKLLRERSYIVKTQEVSKESSKELIRGERQRTKTRTLDEDEVKILTPDVVENNAGMMNLSQKLLANPKVFYVDLEVNQPKPKKDKSSDEEISYEDDFESYESDFDSYHSENTEAGETSEMSEKSDKSNTSEQSKRNDEIVSVEESSLKEKDEEKMLDSGNFDLRDQRSAKSKPAVMDFILEGSEDRKTVSLTDEGFQDMSSSSAGSSLKTQQADRTLFIDFAKSKQSKLKRKIYEHLQQRAKDLLGMITLHEMSYSLFEMQPISYDLYMATFGRSNYTQIGVQTFDDGITEEIQTDEIAVSQKWSQHPVEFSKSDICTKNYDREQKQIKNPEDYLAKFTFLMKSNLDNQKNVKGLTDENYKTNPLRIYLEQKDGVGGDEILPSEIYKSKLKTNDFNSSKLGKFLKKIESRLSHVLTSNTGHKELTNLAKSNKIPFSKGYFSLSTKTISDEKLSFLKNSKISLIVFSDSKANLILTIHNKAQNVNGKKTLICLWDLSVARVEPLKVLTAIDDVIIGRFRGDVKGVFVAALEDGSIHLWDLAEEPTWYDDASDKKPAEFVEIDTVKMTEFERDREWNLKNSHLGLDESQIAMALQSCAYTSSATNITAKYEVDRIVGLEMNTDVGNLGTGRRVVGQILSLQRIGILTVWSIIQEKLKSQVQDIGKAYLSRMKLEKYQTIHLTDHIDITPKQNLSNESFASFNLNAAKRRLSLRKKEKNIIKKQISRPQSAISSKFDFDIDRPSSAASMRKRVLPIEINLPKNWETGVVCNDLKIMRVNNVDWYLVAKNCGEVLCCKRYLGAVRIERFTVATDTASVTNLEVSSKGRPYFLAATDTGTVNLCSLLDRRVLLTLDCSERAYEEWSITTYLVILKDGQSRVEFDVKRISFSNTSTCGGWGNHRLATESQDHALFFDLGSAQTERSAAERILLRNVPSVSRDADKCVADNKGRFISSVTSRRSSGGIEKLITKLEIKSVHWSPVNPCSIYVLLQDSTVVLFELTHSDIYAKYVCEKAAVGCSANDYNLALLTPEGEVQVHRLSNESQMKENLNIFEKYVASL